VHDHRSGVTYAHAASSLLVSIAIVITIKPLFVRTSLILLQSTPTASKPSIEKCIREVPDPMSASLPVLQCIPHMLRVCCPAQISTYDGVLECRSEHWWSLSPGTTVGSLHVRIRSDANEQDILCYVDSLLKKYATHLTIQIEKDVSWMQ